MKKISHYIAIVIAIISLIQIIQILSLGLHRLSDFGYGALAGKSILLALAVFIAIKTKHKQTKATKNN